MNNINDFGLKYYAFDWDDNILIMPTKIYVKSKCGEILGMTTNHYAKKKTLIGTKKFKYKGKIIVGYDNNPFRDFLETGDEQFLLDLKNSEVASKDIWKDFVEAINNGCIFSIITARGHNPNTLKKAVKFLINNLFKGINKKSLIDNLITYHKILETSFSYDEDWLIEDYLNKCKFYPVSFYKSSMSNPSLEKFKFLKKFSEYIEKQSNKVRYKLITYYNNSEKNFKPSIGFSDDDIDNINLIKELIIKNNININIYHTNKGKKIKINI
jgi:hypothetical protein